MLIVMASTESGKQVFAFALYWVNGQTYRLLGFLFVLKHKYLFKSRLTTFYCVEKNIQIFLH